MTNPPNTFSLVAKHVLGIFNPLAQSFANEDKFKGLLYQMGWTPTALPPSYQTLAGVVSNASVNLNQFLTLDSPSASDILSIMNTAKNVFEGVQNISVAPSGVDAGAFLSVFKTELINQLIVEYLSRNLPTVFGLFSLFKIIDTAAVPLSPQRAAHVELIFNWDLITSFFSDPIGKIKERFSWGTPAFDSSLFFSQFASFIYGLGFPVSFLVPDNELIEGYTGSIQIPGSSQNPGLKMPFYFTEAFNKSSEFVIKFLEKPASGGKLPGLIIQPEIPAEVPLVFRFGNFVVFKLKSGTNLSTQFGLTIGPDEGLKVKYPLQKTEASAGFTFGASVEFTPDDPIIIFGDPTASRFQFRGGTISFEIDKPSADVEAILSADLNELSIILAAGSGDGFIQKLIGTGETKVDFQAGIDWSSSSGFGFRGGANLQVILDTHIELGPIEIPKVTLALNLPSGSNTAFGLDVGFDVKANLGPIVCVVDNIGVSLSFDGKPGNLGPVDIGINFKPPNGVGLTVDAGIITGGGYLYINTAKGQYFGALELEFEDLFSLKAVGIIDTKMPDGSKGFSLLIIITADFVPLQLGFGFTLNGVGGLLGLNRTMNVDELKEGIKTNAIKSVLFPQDIIANIDKIVSDLEQIFPIYEGHFIVGPMGELGWGAIITLEIGFLIEIPDATIAIPGVLMALIPSEDAPLLRIQVNFVGIIDFDNKIISFDASLYDSNLLVFTLTGDMAFRLSWGDNPYFILSVGGFNPAFTDAPPDLQHMARLGISLLNNDFIQLSVTCYFAVTSNSVQFGANAQLYAGVGALNIYGQLGFDVLFQFDPFKFAAGINVTLQLRSGDSVIMGISVNGQLSGPAPWYVHGDASYTYIITVSVSFSHGWGDAGPDQSQNKIDILALLNTAIADNSNWRVIIPDNNSQHVSIKAVDPGTTDPVVHPFGTLTFSERIVPLGIDITRFGNDLPKDANHFDILASDPGITTIPATDEFAAANFFDLTDDQKLSRHSFDLMTSGFSVSNASDLLTSAAISEDVDYKLSYLGQQPNILRYVGKYRYPKNNFASNLKSSAVSRSPLSYARNRVSSNAPDPVSVVATKYAVANMSDMKLVDGSIVAGSYSAAKAQYDNLLKSQPGLKGQVQIVFDHELSTN